MNSLMGNNQAMSNAKQKAESTGVFSPPFSCSASLCEQLLAGGSGETPAYSFFGRLPYYYFLLLPNGRFFQHQKLEDCRIYTSFYSAPAQLGFWIGRLPYLYFLLLSWHNVASIGILPYLYFLLLKRAVATIVRRLEDCRIYTSFYFKEESWHAKTDWKTAVFILPST